MFAQEEACVNPTIVAAVQFEPRLLDVDHNLALGASFALEAASKGAKIIVLPELCTSGIALKNKDEAYYCAQTKDGYQTQVMYEIASKYDCYIVFGYPQLESGALFNSAAIVGPRGLQANVQKHNLWGPDNLWATPSESQHEVAVTPYGRIGALICRDVMNRYRESYSFYHPGHKFYAKGSADVIALLTNWSSDYGYPDSSWVELCEETRSNVIVSNRIGKERDLSFKGGSCVIARDKSLYTNGSSFTESAVVGGIII